MPCGHRDMLQLCGYWAVSQHHRYWEQTEQLTVSDAAGSFTARPVKAWSAEAWPVRCVQFAVQGQGAAEEEPWEQLGAQRWAQQERTADMDTKQWNDGHNLALNRSRLGQLFFLCFYFFLRKHRVCFFPFSVPGEFGKPWEKQRVILVSIQSPFSDLLVCRNYSQLQNLSTSFISYFFTFLLLLLLLDSYCFPSNITAYFGRFRTGQIERHK